MSILEAKILSDRQERLLEVLEEASNALVDDLIDAKQYSGPDCYMHAANQVDRELHELLVDLVRAKRKEPAPEAQGGEP